MSHLIHIWVSLELRFALLVPISPIYRGGEKNEEFRRGFNMIDRNDDDDDDEGEAGADDDNISRSFRLSIPLIALCRLISVRFRWNR